MIRFMMPVIVAVILLSGCANHYYEVNENHLHIYLNEPRAKEVYFLSSLDHFERHEAMKNNQGVWEVKLPSGIEFRYFFIVDEVVYIPACYHKEKDDFGSSNCVYVPEI
jgi:hypothetical protein